MRTSAAKGFLIAVPWVVDHPDWLSDEGDTCYILIRLEYDHEAMLDHYSEVEIEEKREQFRERMDEMEE